MVSDTPLTLTRYALVLGPGTYVPETELLGPSVQATQCVINRVAGMPLQFAHSQDSCPYRGRLWWEVNPGLFITLPPLKVVANSRPLLGSDTQEPPINRSRSGRVTKPAQSITPGRAAPARTRVQARVLMFGPQDQRQPLCGWPGFPLTGGI